MAARPAAAAVVGERKGCQYSGQQLDRPEYARTCEHARTSIRMKIPRSYAKHTEGSRYCQTYLCRPRS
jgi:hypothetical protein